MKTKLILSILFLLPIYLFAQTNADSFQIYLIKPFKNLNTTDITTHILYDRTIHFSNMQNYIGSDMDTIDRDEWENIYLELYNSSFRRGECPHSPL
ncbi:MAG: hypothetical protein RI955_1489 [Bacteroidota bacterium]